MKKIFALIMAILMIAALSGCSNAVDLTATGGASGVPGVSGNIPNTPSINGGNAVTPDGGSEAESESGDASGDASDLPGGEASEVVDETTFTRNGTTVTFGSYPQKEVTDTTLVESLTTKAGELPSSLDKKNWTAIENMTDTWYIDVTENGKKYRGVYFTTYRPAAADGTGTVQYDNGYETEKAYWFEYSPISWTILKEDGGKAFIFCDLAINAQPYDSFSNSYAGSAIRNWLNSDFYNTAFNKLQQALIVETVVDNSADSTGTADNQYASENTNDKVFLLSRPEAKELSFNTKEVTDYAKVMGVYQSGNCWWWTRSPYHKESDIAYRIKTDGTVHSSVVSVTTGGVVPALWINLGEAAQ